MVLIGGLLCLTLSRLHFQVNCRDLTGYLTQMYHQFINSNKIRMVERLNCRVIFDSCFVVKHSSVDIVPHRCDYISCVFKYSKYPKMRTLYSIRFWLKFSFSISFFLKYKKMQTVQTQIRSILVCVYTVCIFYQIL